MPVQTNHYDCKLVACCVLWDCLDNVKGRAVVCKTKEAATVVVGAVQQAEHKAEVTASIKGQGTEQTRLVRWLVDPIKDRTAKG